MVDLAADWLQSLLAKEILIPVTNFELSEIDPNHYQLRFDMPDADPSFRGSCYPEVFNFLG
jgi:hypothetical protein